jgi:hypothetical protein
MNQVIDTESVIDGDGDLASLAKENTFSFCLYFFKRL